MPVRKSVHVVACYSYRRKALTLTLNAFIRDKKSVIIVIEIAQYLAPLVAAKDALILDSTSLSIDELLKIVSLCEKSAINSVIRFISFILGNY